MPSGKAAFNSGPIRRDNTPASNTRPGNSGTLSADVYKCVLECSFVSPNREATRRNAPALSNSGAGSYTYRRGSPYRTSAALSSCRLKENAGRSPDKFMASSRGSVVDPASEKNNNSLTSPRYATTLTPTTLGNTCSPRSMSSIGDVFRIRRLKLLPRKGTIARMSGE